MMIRIPPVIPIKAQNRLRQPSFCTRYPVMTNAMGGLNVDDRPYTIIALPLSLRSQTSEILPPVFVRGAEPPNPWISRHTITVGMLCASARGIWNMTSTNQEPMYTGFRPKYSDRGASSIGPGFVDVLLETDSRAEVLTRRNLIITNCKSKKVHGQAYCSQFSR